MLIFKFKKCLILSLLFLSACYASAAEISIKECLSAQVDVAALNSLNSMALSIFPYTLEDSSSPDIKKVSSEEYIQKVIEFQKNKDSMAKYEKLLDNLQIFFVSGGIMIKSMDPKAKANKGYYSCGTYSRDPISENILKDIPNLSPLLVGAVSKKLIQAAAKHQEVLLGRTADNLYFLVFGYSGWGAKNRKNAEEFNQVMACTIDQIDDSGNRISDENEACEQIKKTEQYIAYRVYLTSSILTTLFVYDYTHKPFNEIAFGLNGRFVDDLSAAQSKLAEQQWLGGAAFALTRTAYSILIEYYKKNLPAEQEKTVQSQLKQ